MHRKNSHHFNGYILTLCLTAVLAISIRRWVAEPYQIPSKVMSPTLIPGDTVLVWKWPFQTYNKGTPLRRGEVIVFKSDLASDPSGTPTHYIRRVIGLPGDRVGMKGGHTLLNSRLLEGSPPPTTPITPTQKKPSQCTLEKLPDSASSFQICFDPDFPSEFDEQKVPPNTYLVVGDWRSEVDSKKGKPWILVPASHVQGKPWFIWLSIDYTESSSFLPHLRSERMLQKIE